MKRQGKQPKKEAHNNAPLLLPQGVEGKIDSITGKIPAMPCGDREKRVLKCVA